MAITAWLTIMKLTWIIFLVEMDLNAHLNTQNENYNQLSLPLLAHEQPTALGQKINKQKKKANLLLLCYNVFKTKPWSGKVWHRGWVCILQGLSPWIIHDAQRALWSQTAPEPPFSGLSALPPDRGRGFCSWKEECWARGDYRCTQEQSVGGLEPERG